MIPSPWTQRRLLIPRWRSLFLTITASELAAPHLGNSSAVTRSISSGMREKLIQWRHNPGVITAGELTGTALVEAQESEAVPAARYLMSTASSGTTPLRRLAALALKRAGLGTEIPADLKLDPHVAKRDWRQRTRIYPQNALAWVELSLHDVIGGKKKEAERSMLVALQLAPNNRHVLRSASRLFLHLDDPGRAYDIISKCDATISDPWLMAAELSMAELAGRKPKYFRQGSRILAGRDLVPRQITELAGAIGTLELSAGRRRKARDYFRQSVDDPTGSALAQAEWASPLFDFSLVPMQRFAITTEVDEAKTFHLLHGEQFSDVPDVCLRWSEAEPYSIRPYEIASSATSLIEDHRRTLELTRKGLALRPKAPMLLNNRAFALAHLGQLDEAERTLQSIQHQDEMTKHISQANRGLLAMRRGEHILGSAHYREAINGFGHLKEDRFADVARIYLAREAALAIAPNAEALVKDALDSVDRLQTGRYNHIVEMAKKALAANRFLRNRNMLSRTD